MRMYATEDKNLAVSYTVNGEQMGSSITVVPDQLTFDVTVYDPDKSDSISKVELVANSGKVVYTWDDPAQLAAGALTATLSPDYSYYFVRVTEGDGRPRRHVPRLGRREPEARHLLPHLRHSDARHRRGAGADDHALQQRGRRRGGQVP